MLWTIEIRSKTAPDDGWDEWDEEAYSPDVAKERLLEKLKDPKSEPSRWYGTDAIVGRVYECPVPTFQIFGGEA